ncbi:MAG: hypothetical protein HRT73_00085 [Flavobacteriales bacterium]|nr:hypothetical protein [Flavobacteriales bacterium]
MKNKIKLGAFALVAFIISSCGNTENTSEEKGVTIIESQKEVIKDYDYYLSRIAEDEEWMVNVKNKAEELGITTEEELSNNARYMAEKNGFSDEAKKEEIVKDYDYYLKRIAEDEDWMKNIHLQATELGISIDSAVRKNAKHMVEES